MIDRDREEFERQAGQWRKRADAQGGVVSHVVWRNGHMDAQITQPVRQPPEPVFVSRRGLLL